MKGRWEGAVAEKENEGRDGDRKQIKVGEDRGSRVRGCVKRVERGTVGMEEDAETERKRN